ncbi:MAG: hypothetical protein K2Y39_13290 [Candidatus Obscuribacterales bacterium]|nr:hypothetical protein [Candidatus Obscuribacterales bacterium]
MLTFVYCRGAFADLENERAGKDVSGSPTRIKRDVKIERKKTSGYHNQVRSPSRDAGDESYLLVAEEPKTDEEKTCRKFEAIQLPKILSVLKTGNFAKAQQMLTELALSMPVDSQARYLYQTLAKRCESRRDAEYWYRYDIKEMRHLGTRRSIADLPVTAGSSLATSTQSNDSVHSLRKEAWLLLGTEDKK